MQVPQIPLDRGFYNRSPIDVAQQLLGKAIVRRLGERFLGGLIVETEAYLSTDDPASHSFRGISKRNRSMFADAGTLYVYTIHAKFCLNVVTESEGVGSAVLIRALEPLWSIRDMQTNRKREDVRQLCRGPAMLCQALGVNLSHDGLDLCASRHLWLAEVGIDVRNRVRCGPRIGISRAIERPLRCFVDGNRFVSGRARSHSLPVRESLVD